MDSQVTLVNFGSPHASLDGYTVLQFHPDDVHNCRISVWGDSSLSYTVESNPTVTTTHIHRTHKMSRTLLATIERRSISPDTVRLGEKGEPMRIHKWLKTKLLSDFPAVMELSGRQYLWRPTICGQLTMSSIEEPNTPLAVFNKSRLQRDPSTSTFVPARLIIKDDLLEDVGEAKTSPLCQWAGTMGLRMMRFVLRVYTYVSSSYVLLQLIPNDFISFPAV